MFVYNLFLVEEGHMFDNHRALGIPFRRISKFCMKKGVSGLSLSVVG